MAVLHNPTPRNVETWLDRDMWSRVAANSIAVIKLSVDNMLWHATIINESQ